MKADRGQSLWKHTIAISRVICSTIHVVWKIVIRSLIYFRIHTIKECHQELRLIWLNLDTIMMTEWAMWHHLQAKILKINSLAYYLVKKASRKAAYITNLYLSKIVGLLIMSVQRASRNIWLRVTTKITKSFLALLNRIRALITQLLHRQDKIIHTLIRTKQHLALKGIIMALITSRVMRNLEMKERCLLKLSSKHKETK
jgi:hypothetical protein